MDNTMMKAMKGVQTGEKKNGRHYDTRIIEVKKFSTRISKPD